MTIPVAGGGIDSAFAWLVGETLRRVFPPSGGTSSTPPPAGPRAQQISKRWGRPPDNQAFGDYTAAHADGSLRQWLLGV
jgi:hypothetical protein